MYFAKNSATFLEPRFFLIIIVQGTKLALVPFFSMVPMSAILKFKMAATKTHFLIYYSL